MMKKRAFFVAFVSVLFLQSLKAEHNLSDYSPSENSIYFAFALKAAGWLKSLAIETSPGTFKWPVSEERPSLYSIGQGFGAAGIGTFFLELFKVTGNPDFCRYAEGAGRYIGDRGFENVAVDWLSGPAGAGCFLVDLWKATGDPIYLELAEEAAGWLILKHKESNGGFYWVPYSDAPDKLYTGYAHGVAGIGFFFTLLYDATGDVRYLSYADGAAQWIFSYMWEPQTGHYCWPRLTADTVPNTTWCGGSVGILKFLLKLYESSGNLYCFSVAKGATNWLLTQASSQDGQYSWGSGHAYCHGTPSVIHVLYRMYQKTADFEYLRFARGGAEWLENEAEKLSEGIFRWTHYTYHDTGLLTGTAGVGHSFVLYSEFDPRESYLEYAKGAAHWLISAAEFEEFDRVKWINYIEEYNQEYGIREHETSWYNGAAGIGLFFLRLSQALIRPQNGNSFPTLNTIGDKTVTEEERLMFCISGSDPDGDSLVFIGSELPQGASLTDNCFVWDVRRGREGTYFCYFIVTDGWGFDWEKITIQVLKGRKKGSGRR